MARQLHHASIPLSTSQVGLAAMTLLLCAFALFMCASHSRQRRRWSAYHGSYCHDPVIELNNEAVILSPGFHGTHLTDRDESLFSGEQQGVSVWQKNIMMGGKCQLPDFSGVIIYDSNGNVINPVKNPRPLLTWK